MQTEPSKADPPKRKRCWYQFSLRSLMIAVALFAVPMGYVGWQAKVVRERASLLNWEIDLSNSLVRREVIWDERLNHHVIPWFFMRLGDKEVALIELEDRVDDATVTVYKTAFPEANVYRRMP